MLEKRKQMMTDYRRYRENKEEEFEHYKQRRIALRNGK